MSSLLRMILILAMILFGTFTCGTTSGWLGLTYPRDMADGRRSIQRHRKYQIVRSAKSLWLLYFFMQKVCCLIDMYQCGPAPLVAVRRGDVGLGFDVPFIFTEVNADVCHFVADKNSSWGFSKTKLNTYL